MLIIFPPAAKACEPPAGLGYLSGFLINRNVDHHLVDLNIESLLAIAKNPTTCQDKWSQRAGKNIERHIESLQRAETYTNYSRYERAVNDINRMLQINTPAGHNLTLANYEEQLAPTSSEDLIQSFCHPEKNIFFEFFNKRLDDLISDNNFTYVGISLNYLSQALCSFSIAGYIKKHYPHLKLILGGGLVTSWVRSPGWSDPFKGYIDYLVAGAGEQGLSEILQIDKQGVSPSLIIPG